MKHPDDATRGRRHVEGFIHEKENINTFSQDDEYFLPQEPFFAPLFMNISPVITFDKQSYRQVFLVMLKTFFRHCAIKKVFFHG